VCGWVCLCMCACVGGGHVGEWNVCMCVFVGRLAGVVWVGGVTLE